MNAADKLLDSYNRPLIEAMDKEGLTLEYLVKKLKKELNAKTEREVKDKKKSTAKKPVFKTVYKPIWNVQQAARMDANKLRGDYAPVNVHHSASDELIEALTQAKIKARGGNETE